MIVNLAEQTQHVLLNANLSINDIKYVIYYNIDDDELQRCSYSEFISIAEDINYDEFDPMFQSRKIIYNTLQIIADGWWLRRPDEDEDDECWIYGKLPVTEDELRETQGELVSDYILDEMDVSPDDYIELMKPSEDEISKRNYRHVPFNKYTLD